MNGTLVFSAMLLTVGMAFIACAREGLPPGGPQDTFPPYVVKSVPTSGSSNVPLDVFPMLIFNERIDPRSIEGNLFIAPITTFDTEINWRGNEVTIRFEQAIESDQTYIITVGTGIRDLNGNHMDSTYIYALSTGLNIDDGQIDGLAIFNERPTQGAYIWAYQLSKNSEPNPTDTPPDYLAQTDTEGAFTFTHLSADRYRLFAFLDRNRNRLYDAGVDPLGIPTQDVILSEKELDGAPLWFWLTVNGTKPDIRPDILEHSATTIDSSDYGSLSGWLEDEGKVVLSLLREGETEAKLCLKLEGPGRFRFNHVLPGWYILRAYHDTNRNGRYDFGNVKPFVPAERSIFHPDTLEIRSGWETEGIEIKFSP